VLHQFKVGLLVKELQKKKKLLPVQLANIARNEFVGNFKRQGFRNIGVEKWKEVKRREHGSVKAALAAHAANPKARVEKGMGRRMKPILVQSGTLRKAVAASIQSTTWREIKLGVEVPYAEYLNDGTDNMVARPFMKDSQYLQRALKNKLISEIKSALTFT
jgi:hypothetical protein